LLRRLIESYESSTSFGRTEGWARDVIVRLDEKTFPAAFAPDGADEWHALVDAAVALERDGAVRLVYQKGARRELPKEVRLGPGQVSAAYAAGRAYGIRPLAEALEKIATTAEALRSPGVPLWMEAFLRELPHRLREGDTTLLRASRARVKERGEEVSDAIRVAAVLSRGEGGMERIVSERVFGRSKRLGEVRSWIRTILEVADPRWRDAPPPSSSALLEYYGMRTKPVFLFCAGGIEYDVRSGMRSLLDDIPSSAISEGLVAAVADAAAAAGPITITTIENETPYHLYVEEQGGPEGLAGKREIAVYAGGYPSSVVMEFLERAASGKDVRFRHWGDPDGNGFQIWWMIRTRLGRPVDLLRMSPEWVHNAARRESRPLSMEDQEILSSLTHRIANHPELSPDLAAATVAIAAVQVAGKWIEQERHYSG
jgi:hypothetical protein